MNPERIGKFICELRKEKGLSQYQLADMIPISRQGVSKWERGVTTPDPQTLIRLSELFNVTIDELLRGEKSDNNTIEKLEETTLSILDQSNKKTKTIKRITRIFIFIIITLLLAFLSYYFINSYNSIEVYKVGNTNDKFTTYEGIFITTREKYYLKLGKIKNKIAAEINSIKLIYKKDNKTITLVEDQDIDNIVIMDSYGYGEKFSKREIENLKNNLYIEIDYNETEKVEFKLRCERDYKNNSLFFKNQQKQSHKNEEKEVKQEILQPEEKKEEEKKEEETKPVVKETQQSSQPLQQKEQKPEETPTEPEITIEQIVNKIKEKGTLENSTYTYGNDDYTIMIMYYENTNKIEYYENYNLIGTYDIERNLAVCKIDNCEVEIAEIIKNYLFK